MPNAEAILATYGNLVYRLAYARTQNRTDADDIFQEVFFRYIRKQPAFASDEHGKAWFIRVTLNCAKTHWRRFHRTEPLDEQTALSVVAEPLGNTRLDTGFDTGLTAALEQLPVHSRTLIHLYYFEGYSTEELAKLLHQKPSTIRTQLTRARQKLRVLLKGDEDDGKSEPEARRSPGRDPICGSLPQPERTDHP